MKYLKRKGLIGKGRRIVQYETLNLTKVFIIQNPFQLAFNFLSNNFIACHVVFNILHVYTPSRAKILIFYRCGLDTFALNIELKNCFNSV